MRSDAYGSTTLIISGAVIRVDSPSNSVVTDFGARGETVVAIQGAVGATHGLGAIVGSKITFLVQISNTIATRGCDTTNTTLAGSDSKRKSSAVTGFIVDGIDNPISAEGKSTAGFTTSVGNGVTVVDSIIALFQSILQVQLTVATFPFAN